jgi:LysR family hydrogen peroxide-inducible transcriptional activator
MTLIQLEYVLAVAEYKNFTIAAEKTFVTQPTLSMQIQKLEKELGIEIFDRSTHPIQLTLIGEIIVNQSKIILKEVRKIEQIVNEEKGMLEGDFTIGVIPTVLPTLIPMFYKKFQQNYPKANLIIRELQTQEIIEGLEKRTIDFGLAVTPLHEEKIIEKILYYEPMVAYIPATHELHKQMTIRPSELNIDSVLLLKEGNCFRNNVLNLCDPKHISNQPVKLDSGSLDTLVKLANEGYGMTVLPLLHAEDLPVEFKKNIKYFNEPVPTRQVSLIYHQSNLRVSFEENLIKTIQGIIRGKIFLDRSTNVISPMMSLPEQKTD